MNRTANSNNSPKGQKMDDAQFALIIGKLQEDAEISHDDRRDLWNAINVLRDLMAKNATDQRDLMGKLDQTVQAMTAQAASAKEAALQVEKLAKRVTDVETARTAEMAAEKAERRVLVGIATVIGGFIGPIAIWILQKVGTWMFLSVTK